MTTVGWWNLFNLLLMNCMCPYPFIPSYYLLVSNVIIRLLTPNCKRTVCIMHYEACTRGTMLYYTIIMKLCIRAFWHNIMLYNITYSYIYNSRPVTRLQSVHICSCVHQDNLDFPKTSYIKSAYQIHNASMHVCTDDHFWSDHTNTDEPQNYNGCLHIMSYTYMHTHY